MPVFHGFQRLDGCFLVVLHVFVPLVVELVELFALQVLEGGDFLGVEDAEDGFLPDGFFLLQLLDLTLG